MFFWSIGTKISVFAWNEDVLAAPRLDVDRESLPCRVPDPVCGSRECHPYTSVRSRVLSTVERAQDDEAYQKPCNSSMRRINCARIGAVAPPLPAAAAFS